MNHEPQSPRQRFTETPHPPARKNGRALTRRGGLPVLAAAALAVLSGGCAFLRPAESESHYYLLTAARLPAASAHREDAGPGRVVRLLPVDVAGYLQTKDMAVRTGSNEVVFAQFHRWAEPLDAGVRRVLAGDLRASPGIHAVLTDEPAPAQGPVFTVSVRVLACEGSGTNRRGSAIFEAAWEITRTGPEETTVAHGVFRARPADWHPGDYGQLAEKLSRAVGDFSRVLSNAISGRK